MATTRNIDQIYPHTSRIGFTTLTTAQTSRTGTGSTAIFTASAEGSIALSIICVPHGTNVASVLRVFVNDLTTKSLIHEVSLPATTTTEVAANQVINVPCNIWLPSGYKIEVSLGTTVAAGWQVTCRGGDY